MHATQMVHDGRLCVMMTTREAHGSGAMNSGLFEKHFWGFERKTVSYYVFIANG